MSHGGTHRPGCGWHRKQVCRTLQLVALLVFLAVLVILLTPADDGVAMSLRGDAAIMMLFFGLLALAGRWADSMISQFRHAVMLAPCPGVLLQPRGPSFLLPLLC